MPNPFLSEIALFSFDFAPQGWAQCNGQILPIAQNQALFALLGTTYGGNGQTTFALPDLRGRVPIGFNQEAPPGPGPGLENYFLGRKEGGETTTLSLAELPSHNHGVNNTLTFTARARNSPPNQQTPVGTAAATSAPLPFSDPVLTPGITVIKTTHFTELRTRINTFRAAHGLAPFSYTSPVLTVASTVVQAQHLLDLRTALSQGYSAAALSPPNFAEPIVVGSTVVKASHLMEIRNLLNAVTPVGSTYSRTADANMSPAAIALTVQITAQNTGAGQPHDNNQPYLALRYCIALQGIFPSQNP